MKDSLHAVRSSTVSRRVRTATDRSRRNGKLIAEWVAVATVSACLLAACLFATQLLDPDDIPTRPVRVEPGQSLWRLAVENPVPGLSRAETSDLIRRINRRDTSLVRAGEVIYVPAQDQDERSVVYR